MSNRLLLPLLLIIVSNAGAQVEPAFDVLSLGRRVVLHSNILGEDRVLNIYLPPDYDALPNQNFDVIYLLDGSWDEDFVHVSGVVQYLSFPWIHACAPTIVVGIANVDRRRDFTFPTTVAADQAEWPTTGHSGPFIAFLEKELQPYIAQNFRTTYRKTLIGQSLGGLLGCQIYLENNRLFTDYIIISPSLWWDNGSLLKRYREAESDPNGYSSAIQFAVGHEGREMKRYSRRLNRWIKARRKYSYHSPILYFKDLEHGDIAHIAVYRMLSEMYRRHNRRDKL